ncbi:DMT family transporter [Donghicola sp. C2-DW-16]|uniref:DMT family transporter n=1 Tax=Donghicola mangrovi TaxID=2729614 RepID=A0A850QAS8_9RHOB|nr:DMT family transporter [Donghicola mangrovi]NVO23389.1 DMT family transporter [Donghicola mangrovi]NVO27153.1 DMT family transporter [Donghicola mangrovi]
MEDTRVQRPGRGIFWMVLTGFQFVGMTALVKAVGTSLPVYQTSFLRFALGLVFFIPLMPSLIRTLPTAQQAKLIALRGLAHTIGVSLWFYAMVRIPLADVTALNYLNPIYVTLGASLFLGEKLALRRLIAVGVALLGAGIILRPGFRELDPGHIAMLGTSLGLATGYLIAKRLSAEMSSAHVVAWLSIAVTIGLMPMAVTHWVHPTWEQLAVLLAVAALATGAHYTMTLAFKEAPVAVTQPATFLQLVWAVALGALVFGEGIDPYTVLGGGVIIASVSYITWREAMLKRRITPPSVATKT